jgi:hypothetical protein
MVITFKTGSPASFSWVMLRVVLSRRKFSPKRFNFFVFDFNYRWENTRFWAVWLKSGAACRCPLQKRSYGY